MSKFNVVYDKEKAKALELTTVPMSTYPCLWCGKQQYFELGCKLLRWYHSHDIAAGDVKQKWGKLTEMLGPPTYYANYEYRNAVWLLQWKKQDVLLFCDKKGLSLQVTHTFPQDKCMLFVYQLIKVLFKKGYKDPYEKIKIVVKENGEVKTIHSTGEIK